MEASKNSTESYVRSAVIGIGFAVYCGFALWIGSFFKNDFWTSLFPFLIIGIGVAYMSKPTHKMITFLSYTAVAFMLFSFLTF